jgi:hypothetical protein
MKRIKAAPGAKRLIESLRNLGYDCATAIADLVDNSIVASASEVHIQILAQHGSRPPAIVIADNGRGMDREKLQEAMRFGAYQDYSAEDLGKYGLGLKTASLSQCRMLTVASKARAADGSRPRRHYARWDLDFVDGTDDWDLLLPQAEELDPWELQELEHEVTKDGGTTVLWTGLDEALPLLGKHDVRQRERFLASLIDEVSAHVRMVFHRFMDGTLTGRRKLHIYLCGEELTPWDPFCRDEKTRDLDILRLPVTFIDRAGNDIADHVTISPFILPREDEFSTLAAHRDASGPRNWNMQQGFYFYRNNRLLQAGGWSYLRSVDEHVKLLRVAVHFPQKLDHAFEINITKMRARIPAGIRDTVRQAVSKWAKAARERYDRAPGGPSAAGSSRPSPSPIAGKGLKRIPDAPPAVSYGGLSFVLSNAPGHSLTVSYGPASGQVKVIVPHGHVSAALFAPSLNGNGDYHRLALAMLSVLEAVYERRLKPENVPLEPLRRALQRLKA